MLDLDVLERNLSTMADYCRVHGKTLRPHAKTHKSTRIAALQAKHGAIGICAATLREAAAMIASGVRGVLVTSPMVGEGQTQRRGAASSRTLDKNVLFVTDSLIWRQGACWRQDFKKVAAIREGTRV